jgi:TM2 domain-containing membrane protein YozV
MDPNVVATDAAAMRKETRQFRSVGEVETGEDDDVEDNGGDGVSVPGASLLDGVMVGAQEAFDGIMQVASETGPEAEAEAEAEEGVEAREAVALDHEADGPQSASLGAAVRSLSDLAVSAGAADTLDIAKAKSRGDEDAAAAEAIATAKIDGEIKSRDTFTYGGSGDTTRLRCDADFLGCGAHGACESGLCTCESGWLNVERHPSSDEALELGGDVPRVEAGARRPCAYDARSHRALFYWSAGLGWLGADYFYLSRGESWYIGLGCTKALTLGGIGIWWLFDVARIYSADATDWTDGLGAPLRDDWNNA